MSHPSENPDATTHSALSRTSGTFNRLIALAFFGDAMVICLSLLLAYWLRFETALAGIGVPDLDNLRIYDYHGHFLVGLGIMLATLTNYRFYERSNFLTYQQTFRIIVKSSLVWVAVYLGLSLILKFNPGISRLYALTGMLTMGAALTVWRWIFWKAVQSESIASRLRKRALVVGWSPDFGRAYTLFGTGTYRQFDVCGVVESPMDDHPPELPDGVRRIGRYEDLETLLKMKICDVVLVADIRHRRTDLLDLASLCEKEMIEFKLAPTCFRVLLSGLHLESLGGIPVLGISKLPLHSVVNQYIKRAIDIVGALVGLTIFTPVIAVFGALVRLESPGPIFYRQRRLGADGRVFEIIKLRSMRIDAESGGSPGWTVKDDPRVLRIGGFMRRWNIDELPQFWNVLKGEMSLVGPRPERPELIENFKEDIPHYNARHHIKPGITGWAQVNGLRGDTDLGERVRFDLHYIENWNVLFDIQIMAMTFIRRENAC